MSLDVILALGGGGTRGAAHIGVLRFLEESGFNIRAISGTSIGSIVGAFYSKGFTPNEIENIFTSIDQTKLYGWPLTGGAGLLGVSGISDFLKANLGDISFDELRLPFAAVAVDLNSNREIILRSGKVIDAILGSIAVPGLFPPKQLNEYRLIDGGTLDPIPVRAVRNIFPDLPVIAVSLLAPIDIPATPIGIFSIPTTNPITKQFARLTISQSIQVFADSVDIASRQMAELRLKLDKPDIVIRPNLNGINLLDKINVREVVARGEKATEKLLPEILACVSLQSQIVRKFKKWGKKINNEAGTSE